MRLLSFHKELPNMVLVREHPPAPLCKGWCSAQRIKITMTAGGSHTTMYCWQKSLIFD